MKSTSFIWQTALKCAHIEFHQIGEDGESPELTTQVNLPIGAERVYKDQLISP
jgi:hypothetical protein